MLFWQKNHSQNRERRLRDMSLTEQHNSLDFKGPVCRFCPIKKCPHVHSHCVMYRLVRTRI